MGKHTRCIHHLHAFLLVLVHTSLVASTSRFRCPAEQAAALLRLKQSFQDPLLLPSWQARTDCCQWEGVSCDPDDASGALVAALNLSGYGLQNPSGLDRALLQLSSLRRLNLAGNDFGGASLPASGIEQLTELAHLNLSNAGFAGQIPTGFSSLTKLMSLDLSYNQGYTSSLSGAIPEFFADFRSLAILQLSNNDFNGSFPRGIFQLKSLRMLDLSSNPKLSGILPAELPARSSLEVLVLSETKFSGAIPSSIGNLKRLKTLDIRDSTGRFSGGLPVSISDLKFLSFLDLSNSGLQIGELPDAISSLQSLSTLRLRDCGISGAIPSSIENLTRLSELDQKSKSKLPLAAAGSRQLPITGSCSSLQTLPLRFTARRTSPFPKSYQSRPPARLRHGRAHQPPATHRLCPSFPFPAFLVALAFG